jgi:mannose-6-phosphate isomerase-like protein (cupin superfamily)
VSFARGQLHGAHRAPETGEEVHRLAEIGGSVVEQILSGALPGPVDYLEESDEWVVVLEGHAVLEVEGTTLSLSPGDWVHLPAGTPHRLVSTDPGTSWLSVTSSP